MQNLNTTPNCGDAHNVRGLRAGRTVKICVGSGLTVNCLITILSLLVIFAPGSTEAQDTKVNQETKTQSVRPNAGSIGGGNNAVGAGLAAGLAAIAAGIGVGMTGAAAIGAITEKPGMLGRTLIFVGLAEGIAIYGLIVAFMILTGAFGG